MTFKRFEDKIMGNGLFNLCRFWQLPNPKAPLNFFLQLPGVQMGSIPATLFYL